MSTVTPNLNLTKPASIENYSLALQNANLDKIDAGVPEFTFANSTFNASLSNFTSSTFARISVGTRGIIVASIVGVFENGYDVTVPANTASPVMYNAAIVPSNMKPLAQVGLVVGGVFSNESRGDTLQIMMGPDGAIGIRNIAGQFSRVSSGSLTLRWNVTYQWNGAE